MLAFFILSFSPLYGILLKSFRACGKDNITIIDGLFMGELLNMVLSRVFHCKGTLVF